MKNQLKIAMVLVISVLLVGCEIAKPSQEMALFLMKVWNGIFGIGYIMIFSGLVVKKWRESNLLFGVIWLIAAYIAFIVFTTFYDGLPFTLGIPFK